ncbi:MAG: hypothetical protein QW244_02165 [Candidatus Pacearchaeota archaeon]
MRHLFLSNKQGISEIVSYVLLIMLSVSLAAMVYTFLQYRAKFPEEIKCPEGVSIYVYNLSCQDLNLILKNNGLFNISGVSIFSYNASGLCNQTLKDFSLTLAPGEIYQSSFGYCAALTKIEILPYRKEKGKKIFCSSAKLSQEC